MAKSSIKSISSANPYAVVLNFQPLVAALDGDEFNTDAGHERPSTKDASLRVVISMMIQNLHNQTVGVINGGAIDNTFKRVTKSEADLAELFEKHRDSTGNVDRDGLNMDRRFQSAMRWYEINEQRHNVYTDACNELKTVYRNITGEDWKPMERKPQTETTTNQPVSNSKLDALVSKFAKRVA